MKKSNLKIKYKKAKSIDNKNMNTFSFFYNLILMIIGCLLASFGTSCFLLPNQLSSGGFSGIATIFYYLFNFQMGSVILILNIPFFIWGYFKVGWKFILRTIFATIIYSQFIDIFEMVKFDINDRLLTSIYGGVINGAGLALVFKTNTSTGGTDLIAHILQKYNIRFRMSNIITCIDTFVVLANLIVFKDLEIGLYSAIAIFIIGKMIDIVFEGINFCKIVYIISDKYEEIGDKINKEANRGATYLYGKGSFKPKDKMIIMCVTKIKEVENLKKISKQVDSNSFIIITDAREVYGLGFKG